MKDNNEADSGDRSSLADLKRQLQSIIVGQEELLDRLLIALLAGGHVLLEGPPGRLCEKSVS